MKFGVVGLRFPKWADSAPPRVSGRRKSPGLLGLIKTKEESILKVNFFEMSGL